MGSEADDAPDDEGSRDSLPYKLAEPVLVIVMVVLGIGALSAVLSDATPARAAEISRVWTQEDNPYVVEVELRNTGTEELTTGAGDFRLANGTGHVHGIQGLAQVYLGDDGFPILVTFGPGEVVRGWILFEQGGHDGPFTVTYSARGAHDAFRYQWPGEAG